MRPLVGCRRQDAFEPAMADEDSHMRKEALLLSITVIGALGLLGIVPGRSGAG